MKYIIAFSFLILLFLFLWINRGHTKIQETVIFVTVTLIAAIIGVLFFSTTSSLHTKDISTIYFISNKDKTPVFFSPPVLTHYHLTQNLLYSEFMRDDTDKSKSKTIVDNDTFFCQLHSASIFNHLFQHYSHSWFIERIAEKFPGFTEIRGRNLGDSKKDLVIYKKDDLQSQFASNEFCKYVGGIGQVALPKWTRIKYLPYSGDHKYCQIELYKPLCFDVKITIRFSSYSVGLGNITHYVGVSEDEYDRTYGTVVINTRCEASFNKLVLGNPTIFKYRKWIESLFNDLYHNFDWKVCYTDIKDYMETTAHQTIIKGNKTEGE